MKSIVDVLDMFASLNVPPSDWIEHPTGDWHTPVWKQFLLTGNEEVLATLPWHSSDNPLPRALLDAIPAPRQMDEQGRRFLRACIIAQHKAAFGQWLQHGSTADTAGDDSIADGCELLLGLGISAPMLAIQVVERMPLDLPKGSPTPAGAFLLSLTEAQLTELVQSIANSWRGRELGPKIVAHVAAHAPDRWNAVLRRVVADGATSVDLSTWLVSLATAPAECLGAVTLAFESLEEWHARFKLGSALAAMHPRQFGPRIEALVREKLRGIGPDDRSRWYRACEAAEWLVVNRADSAIAILSEYIAASPPNEGWRYNESLAKLKNPVLDLAIRTMGRGAIPLLDAAFETEQPLVQLCALKHWTTIAEAGDRDKIVSRVHGLFATKDLSMVAHAVRLAGALRIDAIEDSLWSQLSHKSRQVRDAAAATLATLGDSRLPKADSLWTARRADTRVAVVAWLKAIGTPGAIGVLRARLDDEEGDDVRDAIMTALEELEGGAMTTSPEELRKRIAKTLAKLDGSPVPWLDVTTLPAASLLDGSLLSRDSLLYLLYRQSRVSGMRADIEARPLLAQIDRATSSNLALAVFQAFIDSNADSRDRWAMAFAALVGDDRLVPPLVQQMKHWVDNSRGKLAEYAVQAMALLGTDAALVAVDAMAIRYRTKNRNIGAAASDALTHAADARGVAVEELGDLIVPWLGFERSQPRIMRTDSASIEVRIGSDFKLSYRDAITNKRVAKLPAGLSSEVRSELKDLTTAVKAAATSQLLRMEALAVRQFRWAAPRWEELYLQHPLLLPFAQRLVWGTYDDAGALIGTFRSLDDGSATDPGDEPYVIPPDARIGIVHPLELTRELRQQWLTHLADYDVMPPFAQLERPVVAVNDEQRNVKMGHMPDVALNSMTFKSRAERLGWSRGSVSDSGVVSYYHKTFPGAGVDVFVETQGMFVVPDTSSDISLGMTFFVRHDTVRIGSYVYDEPASDDDPRLVAYGDVPAIAFSEAMGDLAKISGAIRDQQREAA